jgi:hypothetical protein
MCTFLQKCISLLPCATMNVFNPASHELGRSYDSLYDQAYQLDSFALYHSRNQARCTIRECENVALLLSGAGCVLQRKEQG